MGTEEQIKTSLQYIKDAYTPQPGDFGLVKTTPGNWLDHSAADVIRLWTRSPYVHTFVYMGGGQVVEAVSTVKRTPVTVYSDITWSHHTLTELQRGQITAACTGMLGEKYNWPDIAAIALAKFTPGAFGRKLLISKVADDHMEICSQLVAIAYLAAGISLVPGVPPCLVTPGLLNTALTDPL